MLDYWITFKFLGPSITNFIWLKHRAWDNKKGCTLTLGNPEMGAAVRIARSSVLVQI
jgi:hypothetical protein